MNKKEMILILEAKSLSIPFSKTLQKRGMRSREGERAQERQAKVSGRENRRKALAEDQHN